LSRKLCYWVRKAVTRLTALCEMEVLRDREWLKRGIVDALKWDAFVVEGVVEAIDTASSPEEVQEIVNVRSSAHTTPFGEAGSKLTGTAFPYPSRSMQEGVCDGAENHQQLESSIVVGLHGKQRARQGAGGPVCRCKGASRQTLYFSISGGLHRLDDDFCAGEAGLPSCGWFPSPQSGPSTNAMSVCPSLGLRSVAVQRPS
jgi:hypothetical protein